MTGTFRMIGRCDAESNWWPTFCDAQGSPDVSLDLGHDPQRLPNFQALFGPYLVPCEAYQLGGVYYGRPLSGRWPE